MFGVSEQLIQFVIFADVRAFTQCRQTDDGKQALLSTRGLTDAFHNQDPPLLCFIRLHRLTPPLGSAPRPILHCVRRAITGCDRVELFDV